MIRITGCQTDIRHFPCGSVDWNGWKCFVLLFYVESLPLRKCGLKSHSWGDGETMRGHFPCGSVDWNLLLCHYIIWLSRHFPCGSVDWNSHETLDWSNCNRHFPCGSVDWNDCKRCLSLRAVCHFPCGSVDWNCKDRIPGNSGEWSLPLRKCGLKSYLSLGSWPFRLSLPLRKCGLKLCSDIINVIHNRHFPCGSVDWNIYIIGKEGKEMSHFPCGSVDWNCWIWYLNPCWTEVTSLAEVWIEIRIRSWPDILIRPSLPLRKCGLKFS